MTLTRLPDGSFQLAQATHTGPLTGTAADPHPADTHASTGHDDGHEGGFPPFSPQHYASQLIWLAITFGALYYILSKYALPRIAAILADRQARIDADLGEARRLKAESDAAIAAQEQGLAEARARAQKIAGETREAIARQADANRKQIEADLAGKLEAAEAQIATTRTAAMSNVKGIASDAAGAIVTQLGGVQPAAGEVDQAVETVLARR